MPNDRRRDSKQLQEEIKVEEPNDDQGHVHEEVDIDLVQQVEEGDDSSGPRCQLCWDADKPVLLCDTPGDAAKAVRLLETPVWIRIKADEPDSPTPAVEPDDDEETNNHHSSGG